MINNDNHLLNWVPFWTPAVKAEACEVDKRALAPRLIVIGTVAFAAFFSLAHTLASRGALTLAAAFTATPAMPILLAITILSAGFVALDLWTAERMAERE